MAVKRGAEVPISVQTRASETAASAPPASSAPAVSASSRLLDLKGEATRLKNRKISATSSQTLSEQRRPDRSRRHPVYTDTL
jgi:hypothetical protein